MSKRVTKILAIVLGAPIGLALLAFLTLWVRSKDLPSPQDEDLKVQPARIATAENAFAGLQEAAQNLGWADEQDALLKRIGQGAEVDPAAVRTVLVQNRQSLEALDKALERERLQVPQDLPHDKTPYDIVAWRRLGQLLSLRAHSRAPGGDLRASLDDALKLLRFGHMVQGAQGNLLTYLVGGTLKSMALDQVRRSIAAPNASAGMLQPLVALLESSRPQIASFRDCLRAEYAYMSSTIDAPKQASLRNDSMLSRYLYQKNATKKLYADRYRQIAESWGNPCSRLEPDPDPAAEKHQLLAAFWEPNIAGRTIFAIGQPSMKGALIGKCRLQSDLSATQVLVALRLYKTKRGELPASLEALVPDFLPSIPIDDLDGKPLRYSPQAGIVYSVGDNMIDDGGDREKDLVFTGRP